MHGRHLSCARLPRHSTPSPERRAPEIYSLAIPERSVSLRASGLADAAGARERASARGQRDTVSCTGDTCRAQDCRGTAPLRQKDVRQIEIRLPFQKGVSLYGQAGLQTQLARVSEPPRLAAQRTARLAIFINIFQFSHFSQLGLFCATSSHRARTCAASPFGKCFQNQNYVTTLRKKARTRSKNKVFAQNVALCAFRRDSNLFFTLIMGAGRACLTAELSRCDWHSR